jgi:hypothetical protein
MSAGAESFSACVAMLKGVLVDMQSASAGFWLLMQVNCGAPSSTAFDFLEGQKDRRAPSGLRHGITLRQNSKGKRKVSVLVTEVSSQIGPGRRPGKVL